jgi:hypothetical protein
MASQDKKDDTEISVWEILESSEPLEEPKLSTPDQKDTTENQFYPLDTIKKLMCTIGVVKKFDSKYIIVTDIDIKIPQYQTVQPDSFIIADIGTCFLEKKYVVVEFGNNGTFGMIYFAESGILEIRAGIIIQQHPPRDWGFWPYLNPSRNITIPSVIKIKMTIRNIIDIFGNPKEWFTPTK